MKSTFIKQIGPLTAAIRVSFAFPEEQLSAILGVSAVAEACDKCVVALSCSATVRPAVGSLEDRAEDRAEALPCFGNWLGSWRHGHTRVSPTTASLRTTRIDAM